MRAMYLSASAVAGKPDRGAVTSVRPVPLPLLVSPGRGTRDRSTSVHSTLGLATADSTWYGSTIAGRRVETEFYGMTRGTSSFDGAVRGSSGPVQKAGV